MTDMEVISTLQSQLNDLTRRRKGLESDVKNLEKKIGVVDEKLKMGDGSTKMLSLKQYLESEKKRILNSKLSRINLQAKMLKMRIKNIRQGQSGSSSQASIKSSNLFPRHQSEQLSTRDYERSERKYQSLPISRPHTSHDDSKKYCAYCLDNFISKSSFLSRRLSASSIHIDQHSKLSMTHLPLCMSMNICRECTDLRDMLKNIKINEEKAKSSNTSQECVNCKSSLNEKVGSDKVRLESNTESNAVITEHLAPPESNLGEFLTPFFNEAEIKNFCMSCNTSVDQIGNDYYFQDKNEKNLRENYYEMLKTCESAGLCPDCAKLQAQSVDIISTTSDHVIGISQKFAVIPKEEEIINTEELDDIKSISPSILATCNSYAECESCQHNFSKLDMPTPTPSIVQLGCKSHENCWKCAEILMQSRKNSLGTEAATNNQISTKSNDSANIGKNGLKTRSFISIKLAPEDHMHHPRKKVLDEIKKEIDFQSRVVYDTEDRLNKLGIRSGSDEKLTQLKNVLEIENMKLQDIMKSARIEERRLQTLPGI